MQKRKFSIKMGEHNTYKSRIADGLLKDQLETVGAVLIQGPKWCGKTTTAQQQAGSILYMDDPKTRKSNILLAETDPQVLFQGSVPRLIDEWQLAPGLWDAARYEVDRRQVTGQFIFTGSSVPPQNGDITHSGTGRFAWLTMRPMSLWESGESNGSVSLGDLFNGGSPGAISSDISLEELTYLICRGGWPGALSLSRRAALRQGINYVDAIANSDISRADGVSRDPASGMRLLRSYARHQGGQVPISTICADLQANEPNGIKEDAIASYISAMKKIFVVEDMPAWSPNLRSKTSIRTSDTRYFIDPSIASASLGIGPDDLMKDLNTLGLFFETMAVRDLRVYADALDGKVYHYRDKSGLECDAVIHRRNGQYGLAEVKLGGNSLIEEAARTLKKLSEKIDTDRMNEPAFMMVLVGLGQYAYRRKDGIMVVPIGCLKP